MQDRKGWVKVPVGVKRLFGFGPKVTKYKKFVQKPHSLARLDYYPREYETDDPIQAKRFAYEHAKKQRDFYQDLINQGVYPIGTKAKVRRLRHSPAYTVVLFMPKIEDAFEDNSPPKEPYKSQRRAILAKVDIVLNKYDAKRVEVEDVGHWRNYGIDPETGKVAYFDYHVGEVPSPHFDKLKTTLRRQRWLGDLVSKVMGVVIISLMFGLFFLSPNLTGNVVGNLNKSSSNWISGILFLIGLIGIFFYFKKRK